MGNSVRWCMWMVPEGRWHLLGKNCGNGLVRLLATYFWFNKRKVWFVVLSKLFKELSFERL